MSNLPLMREPVEHRTSLPLMREVPELAKAEGENQHTSNSNTNEKTTQTGSFFCVMVSFLWV